ncbi:hypothetical protein BGY98DRAFT_1097721 [Russula aff. rugulosa BPL654]|nr:hypothetical protein BGY98DRAFT_1097721 [Russula aff. rugulosa BPL654]
MSAQSPCSALNNAIRAKGYTYPQIAQSVGTDEKRVRDIVSGSVRPTQQEFERLASSLGIAGQAPRDSSHTTA